MKRTRWLLVGLTVTLAVPFIAWARHMDLEDRNDTRGLLDIHRVLVGGKAKEPRWKIITYNAWGTNDIWDAGFELIRLDTFGSTDFDYYALARSNGHRMVAEVFRHRNSKPDKSEFFIDVWRPNRRSVSLEIPLNRLRRRDTRAYRWYAGSVFSSDRCRRGCLDRAPDRGAVVEPGKPTPTITLPTPTPTTTP